MKWGSKQKGFTIVELLIVVVVIAILAAITIVAYNGIQNRAKQAAVESAASQALRKIEAFKSGSAIESYPTTAAEAGIESIPGVSYFYDAQRSSYCVQAKSGEFAASSVKGSAKISPTDCGQNGLIGWWKFNGNGDDSSGNGRTANITGFPAVGANGQNGSALQFTGSQSPATVPNTDSIVPEQHTFSFWYYTDTWNDAAATSFIAKRGTTTTGLFIMRLTSSNSLSIDCGGSNNRWIMGYAMPLSAWTHVTVTCSPTEVAAYINGVSLNSKVLTGGTIASPTQLNFGHDRTTYSFVGRMDDIRLFDRVITGQEARQLYEDGAK